MPTDPDRIGREILQALESAWNAGDGAAFARPFAEDADFVDIRADHHRGRQPIAAGHDAIFRSIYAGSSVRYTLSHARQITDGVVLVHSRADLSIPSGPMSGSHHATQSLVLTSDGDDWRIASFHNTQSPPPPGQRQQ